VSGDSPQLSVDEVIDVVDSLPAAIGLWDGERRNVFANHMLVSRLRKTPEDVRGMRLAELVGEDVVRLDEHRIAAASAGTAQTYSHKIFDSEGGLQLVQVDLIPTRGKSLPGGFLMVATDITDRLHTETALRDSTRDEAIRTQRHRLAADLDRQVGAGLQQAAANIGAALHGPINQLPAQILVACDAVDATITALRAAVHSLEHPDDTAALPSDDGTAEGDSGAIAVPVPPPARLQPTDIAAEGLPFAPAVRPHTWTQPELLSLLDLLPVGVCVWDADMRNRFINRTALQWLELGSRAQVHGVHAARVLGQQLYLANTGHHDALRHGTPQRFERVITDATGTTRHLQINCWPRPPKRPPNGFVVMLTDITARVRAKRELQDNLGRLAALWDRQRIADDIHAVVLQCLFAVGLDLHSADRSTVVDIAERLRAAGAGIADAVTDLRAAVHSLSNSEPPQYDLAAALQRSMRQATELLHLQATLHVNGFLDKIPTGLATELVAVLNAALLDARSATANDVEVTLALHERHLELRVVDDGRPSAADRAHPENSMPDTLAPARPGRLLSRRPHPHRGSVLTWTALLDSSH
jgi:signal transduction histidine kinase